ncbi:MAG: ArsR/SmtB family transcription factor [Candidatus Dormibacteria bacterium]
MSAVVDTEPTAARWVPADPIARGLMAKFFRALGDPTRLVLLDFCAAEERSGTDCVIHAGLSQGRVSAHLGCLVSCGLLTLRRESRFAYYQVTDPRVLELLQVSREMVADRAASIAACTRVGAVR